MRKVPVLLAAAALLLAALPSTASAHAAVRLHGRSHVHLLRGSRRSGGSPHLLCRRQHRLRRLRGTRPLGRARKPGMDPPTWTSGDSQVVLGTDGLTLTGIVEDVYEFAMPEPEPGAIVPEATGPGGPYVGQATVDIGLEPVGGHPVPFGDSSRGRAPTSRSAMKERTSGSP